MKRLFVADAREGRCVVKSPQAHHLVHVLRMSAGDELEIFDGTGTTFPAKLDRLEGDAVVLLVAKGRPAPPLRRVTVVQGLPKGDKLEWVIQKGTELGASAFAIALCERTIVKVAHVFVLSEAERTTTLSAAFLATGPTPDDVALVVGPEGGLSPSELATLETLHAVPVTLGRLVLRTETAALAALAVLRHLDGVLG